MKRMKTAGLFWRPWNGLSLQRKREKSLGTGTAAIRFPVEAILSGGLKSWEAKQEQNRKEQETVRGDAEIKRRAAGGAAESNYRLRLQDGRAKDQNRSI